MLAHALRKPPPLIVHGLVDQFSNALEGAGVPPAKLFQLPISCPPIATPS